MELQQKINILKRLGVYDKFVYNCLNHHFKFVNLDSLDDIIAYIDRIGIELIYNSFLFYETVEGYDFWQFINDKYHKLFRKNQVFIKRFNNKNDRKKF